MSKQPNRLASGGVIDRSRMVSFRFDGQTLTGHPGDTLASALIANDIRLVGRSFKYHRPRGIYSAGAEEPNALVAIGEGARAEPNTRATMVELYNGLAAASQNRWPSLGFDLLAVNSLLSPLFPAGFYYKTFMWPAKLWPFYEKMIRKAAGLGIGATETDPDHYDKRHAHCDVMVVGGGPAGLSAALAAARTGVRVILADETAAWGGHLKHERGIAIDGKPAADWVAATVAELTSLPNVRLLLRTTAFGYYDGNHIVMAERVTDHLEAAAIDPTQPRQRLWSVRAGRVVIAAGAIERPIVFADNDRPGVMLAGAVRAYVNRYAAAPGKRAVVFANNDDAYRTALDLAAAGLAVPALVDARKDVSPALAEAVRKAGIELLTGHGVVRALGGKSVEGAEIAAIDAEGNVSGTVRKLDCDLIAVSGGWAPSIHLNAQAGGKPTWDAAIAGFVPAKSREAEVSVGGAAGHFSLGQALADGAAAGAEGATAPTVDDPLGAYAITPLWAVAKSTPGKGKRFVDIQDDVTAEDVSLAGREGFISVEHLKRYTTLGMGTDQGKTSNINGLALMARARGCEIPAVGTTTFRAPYTPVTMGTLAGHSVGEHFEPTRRSALHDWHAAQGAVFVPAGLWLRPRCYPKPGESPAGAVLREAAAVRQGVGIVDVSTLGKIDVQGPDATTFIERVYANNFASLKVGRARYGLMLREDGFVLDDGTVARLADQHYLVTTTTQHAGRVMNFLEWLLDTQWPDLKVHVTSVTEQWAAIALAGPKSREVLAATLPGLDISNEALPYLGVLQAKANGVDLRISRISFSGERAYEIAVPADHGTALWQALLEAGAPHGIFAYGTEAMGTLRIEKGHVAGPELDGRTIPSDVGLGRLVSTKKDDFVGHALLQRPALLEADRKALVGLVPADGRSRVRPGSQIIATNTQPTVGGAPIPMLGHVTSAAFSPALGKPIALALLKGGLARKGETLYAAFPLAGEIVAVTVTDPIFVDPEGALVHG